MAQIGQGSRSIWLRRKTCSEFNSLWVGKNFIVQSFFVEDTKMREKSQARVEKNTLEKILRCKARLTM